jgi:hypothetical protein
MPGGVVHGCLRLPVTFIEILDRQSPNGANIGGCRLFPELGALIGRRKYQLLSLSQLLFTTGVQGFHCQ